MGGGPSYARLMRLVNFARPARILLAASAAALAVGLGAGQALAASTWTVTPGGSISASAGPTSMRDGKTHTKFTCSAAALNGTLKSGRGLPGADIGSFASGSFTHCTSPLGFTLTLTLLDLPWHINFTSGSSGVIKGTISHIEISVAFPSCTLVIDGTAGGASDGVLDFTYSDVTHKLTISGGDLHTYKVTGCLGLFINGDPIGVTSTYTISPPQRITSP